MSELHCLEATSLEATTATVEMTPEPTSQICEPRVNPAAVTLAVERAIVRETRGGVQELKVIVRADGVHLRGGCSTYYCKQLAQHAAATVVNGTRLHNEIEVW
jgi:hypothetical protein